MNLNYQQYTSRPKGPAPKKGVPPSAVARNIDDLCLQLPPGHACAERSVLLWCRLEVSGHVCARRGPWSVESFGFDPLIFSGLGRWSLLGVRAGYS
jgi:hypothetical protein